MKKMSSTERATIIGSIIGGLFLLLATMITLYHPTLEHQNKIDFYTIIKPNTDDNNRGKELFEDTIKPNGKYEIIASGWIDLLGDGKKYEYFIKFIPDKSEYTYFALISVRDNRKELLYYEKSFVLEQIEYEFFNRNNKPQLLIYTIGGSGLFLSFSILEYDGTYQLKKVYDSKSYAEGSYTFINNRIVFSGDSKRFELKYKKNHYELIPYHDELIVSNFTATNTISFSSGLWFSIYYNNHPLKFQKKGRSFYTKTPIEVSLNDIIQINDNIENNDSGAIRVFDNNETEYINGFYGKIIFTKLGNTECVIRSPNYDFYHIEFIVKDNRFVLTRT